MYCAMAASAAYIDRQLAMLEKATQALFREAHALSPEQYRFKPDDRTWSAAQIMHHVYLSELLSLAYLRKKLSYPDQVPRYHPKSWFGILLIKTVFALRIKVKAPPTIDMSTRPEPMDLAELETKWRDLREESKSFIAANYAQFGNHLAFRHLFAGRMTMCQMLIFFREHLKHHHRQLKRITSKHR